MKSGRPITLPLACLLARPHARPLAHSFACLLTFPLAQMVGQLYDNFPVTTVGMPANYSTYG